MPEQPFVSTTQVQLNYFEELARHIDNVAFEVTNDENQENICLPIPSQTTISAYFLTNLVNGFIIPAQSSWQNVQNLHSAVSDMESALSTGIEGTSEMSRVETVIGNLGQFGPVGLKVDAQKLEHYKIYNFGKHSEGLDNYLKSPSTTFDETVTLVAFHAQSGMFVLWDRSNELFLANAEAFIQSVGDAYIQNGDELQQISF
jgi:hypothetical protein